MDTEAQFIRRASVVPNWIKLSLTGFKRSTAEERHQFRRPARVELNHSERSIKSAVNETKNMYMHFGKHISEIYEFSSTRHKYSRTS